MLLEGSCQCGAVSFTVESYAPAPFLRCYCSICRKTAGSGGYAINLGARFDTLKIRGKANVAMFRARIDGGRGTAERRFCRKCGSPLWVWDRQWPDLVHPFAGAIDTDLPVPPTQLHMMLGSRTNWVRLDAKRGEKRYEDYPDQSLEDLHREYGLLDGGKTRSTRRKRAAKKK